MNLHSTIAARTTRKESLLASGNKDLSALSSFDLTIEEIHHEPFRAIADFNGKAVVICPEEVSQSEEVAKILEKVLKSKGTFTFSNVRVTEGDGTIRVAVRMGSEVTPTGSINARFNDTFWFLTTIGHLNKFLPLIDSAYLQSYFWTDRFLVHAKITGIDTNPFLIFYDACQKERAKADFDGQDYHCTKHVHSQKDHHIQMKISIVLDDENGERQNWPCVLRRSYTN